MKHHFVPVFYLKHWVGPDGRLCEFSRPKENGPVKPRRTHPAGTGYVKDLYKLAGLAGEAANELEVRFFGPADSAAADLVRKMHAGQVNDWRATERSAWARFIISMLLRSPEDVESLTSFLQGKKDELSQQLQAVEASVREDERFTDQDVEDFLARYALSFLPQMIDIPVASHAIMNMQWSVLNVSTQAPLLMTSDRPVIMTNGIDKKDSFIIVPIGPKKLFVSVNHQDMLSKFNRRINGDLIISINKTVIVNARRYVWARNDSGLSFVRSNFSTEKFESIMERATRKRRALDPGK